MAYLLFLLVVGAALNKNVKGYCYSSEFECDGGRCIHLTSVCDGYEDCFYGDDEYGCDYYCSSSNQYQCTNGYCIPYSQRCDGYNDCGDNSDENCRSSAGTSGGLVAGLCVLGLIIIVVVVVVVGSISYRRSRRSLVRTVPLMTVHPPPPVEVATTVTHVPPQDQFPLHPINPTAQSLSYKVNPPPYTAMSGPGETACLKFPEGNRAYPQ